jgi:hypothetical protein
MSDLQKGSKWYESMPLDVQILFLENITDDQLDIVYDMYFENFSAFLVKVLFGMIRLKVYEYWLEVSRFNFVHEPEKYIIYSYLGVFLFISFIWHINNGYKIIRAFFVVLSTFVNIMMITYPRYNKS